MKTKYHIGFLAAALFLIRCSSNDQHKSNITDSKPLTKVIPPAPFHAGNTIIGTWELRKAFPGYGGGIKNYLPGNGNTLVFSGSRFKTYEDHRLVDSGDYKIFKDSFNHKLYDRISYTKDSYKFHYFMEIKDNQLAIWPDADDAGSNHYDRIK
jgi:hypothetical protein